MSSYGLVERRLPDVELTAGLIGHRLDAMPALPRSVFLLRHVDGLEVAAIGAQLGMAVEDVERELAHAMDVLVWGEAAASHGPGHLCDAVAAIPASH